MSDDVLGHGDDWLDVELEDPVAESRGMRMARRIRHIAVPLALAASALGCIALLGAGSLLARADLGTSLRARSCDASALPAIALFLVAGLLLAAALRVLALRRPTTALDVDVFAALTGAWLPAIVCVAALPGTLGCAAARDIARWQLLGDALTGIGGIATCAAAALAVGVALAHVITIHAYGGEQVLEHAQPSLVELAMDEADELAQDEQLRRFRGVDS